MKDNSFERAMSQIVGQAEAEHQLEVRHARRSQLMIRIRSGVKFALVAAVIVTAFCYRVELQAFVSDKLQHKSKLAAIMDGSQTGSDGKTQGGASSSISKAADNASIRDQIVDEVAK
jgi:hypothetical protein